jgi:SAM-dependent methyltransferase
VDLAALEARTRALGAARAADPLAPAARARRRAAGAFFTPPALAAFVAERVLAPLRGGALTVLDPAAGDGRFLAAAARAGATALIGIERDPATAAVAAAALPGARIVVGEALLEAALGEVDAVVGNPPYVRSIHLRATDPTLWAALRGRFAATSHGEWDLYAAFLERALAWVRPGGRVGLVVPSRWLTSRTAGRLRAHLAGAVEDIVDFGASQVFDGATTYASVVVMERPRGVAGATVATIARRHDAAWSVSVLDTARLGAAPWIVAPTGYLAAAGGPRLGEVACVAKGAGTNADRAFVLEDARWDGEVVRAGDVVVEAAVTHPVLRGRDVTAGASAPTAACVVPYREGVLMPWHELARIAPRAAAHLAASRPRLEAREDGRFRGDGFHAFGRPQNLARMLDPAPKVVVPDVAAAGRACLDQGALVLDSAYFVRPRPGATGVFASPYLCLAVLNAPVVRAWLALAGVPLRGGYVRLKTASLSGLPLPADGAALRRVEQAARAGELAAAVAALGAAYGDAW